MCSISICMHVLFLLTPNLTNEEEGKKKYNKRTKTITKKKKISKNMPQHAHLGNNRAHRI